MSAERVGMALRRAAWLVRCDPNEAKSESESMVDYNLANDVITLGWGDWVVEAPGQVFDNKEKLKNYIDRWYEDNREPSWDDPDKVTAVSGIWRFCNKIDVDDHVVMPSYGLPREASWIAIGMVIGDWDRNASADPGARLYRPVKWLKRRIPKSEVSISQLNQRRWAVVKLDRDEVNSVLQRRGHLTDSDNWSGDEAGVLSDDQLEVPEGAKTRVEVNRYERDPNARRRCLEHYDYTCQVYGLKFEERYGDFARGFMHAHHKVPLSQVIDHDNHQVNPETDLVAVCPNCHAMLHRHPDRPCDVETLRREMTKAQE